MAIRGANTSGRRTAGAVVAFILLRLITRRLLARRRVIARAGPRVAVSGLANTTLLDGETGAVHSVQKADLRIAQEDLAAIWTPARLEQLADGYWRFLTRATLGLIRIDDRGQGHSVVLLSRPLLTFAAPECRLDGSRGAVRWRITAGLLLSRQGRDGQGYLQIGLRRCPPAGGAGALLHVEVEVANFYPSIASGLGRRLYSATQARIHLLITYGFLRSLARVDLAESRLGDPSR